MKSVLSKLVNALLAAMLINAITFQTGMALQRIQPSPELKDETGQTSLLVSEEFTRSLQTTGPWNTFLGGDGDDRGNSLAMDGSGNSFVAGDSSTTWGTPVRTYSAQSDGFVVKLDSSGNLVWNTFLGGNLDDSIQAITIDDLGNTYVIGSSTATWGNPLQPHLGDKDDFVAKLDPSGNLLWNTFLGVERNSNGAGIVVDSLGNIFVNTSNKLVSNGPNYDTAIKLDPSGAAVWNVHLGEGGDVFGHGIALDENENVYVTGVSYVAWGSPVMDFTGEIDAFVAKLDNSSGALLWNTFLGGDGRDVGYGIVTDGSNNLYMTGHSTASWGNPVRAFKEDQDGMVAKLDPSGNLIWNTFLGGVGTDYTGFEIELDGGGNIFVAGASNASWGIPIQSYTGDHDAIIVKLDSSGSLIASTFLGGSGTDKSYGIALGTNGYAFVAGYSSASWGLPVGPYTGGNDAFVTAINFEGIPGLLSVTKVDDTDDGICDSDCSLREAIAAAASASIISFDQSLAGQTISLSSTLIIDKNLLIDGTALDPNVQVSGDSDSDNDGDVLAFSITANHSVEIKGIHINYGFSGENGGGILNAGYLTLKNCSMDANHAQYGGGIYNSLNANLTVSNCTFSNNRATIDGGGITNYGNLEITASTFYSNMANAAEGNGSAIFAEGNSKILSSTFYDHSEGTGTIFHASVQDPITLILENSSFENNNTAFYNYDGKASLNNNTIYANEGGIYVLSGLVDISNSIVSHNFNRGNPTDCFTGIDGSIGKDNLNFFSSDNNCSVNVSGYGVSLNSLAGNGGPTMTMALKPNSPAINAGHDGTCEKTDQRGVARPKGSHCDIGSYEYGEELPPMVVSITRMEPSLTSSQLVDFKVRYSEAVTGVNANDFTFTKTGSIRGYALKSITPATGPADSYIVRVNTGKYNGTLRLNVVDNDSIRDAVNDPLGGPGAGNGNFTSGEIYTVLKKYTITLKSIPAQDGWILESGEKTGNGGQINKARNTIYLGDDAQKKQYRSILSFRTKALPDKAVITKITLKLKKQGTVGSNDPVNALQGFMFDFREGFFGMAAGLQPNDFQAGANKSYGPFKPPLSKGWYSINLTLANSSINRLNTNGGVTQIRLRFKLDDNNNKVANYIKLFSGNAPAASRPQLIIEYYVP